ncbi:MAG: hypothetical protein ACRDV3_02160, partial [Acidothermaceae bacterium]
MSQIRGRAVNRVVGVVVLAGLLSLVAASLKAATEQKADWARIGLVVVCALAATMGTVGLRRGGSRQLHNWRETSLVLGVVLLPPGQLVLALVMAATVAFVIRRMPLLKLVFNAATVAVETATASLIVEAAGLSHTGSYWAAIQQPRAMAWVVVASFATPMVSTLFTVAAIAAERRRRLFAGLVDLLPTALAVWGRNVLAAIAIMAAASWSTLLTAGAIVILLIAHFFSTDRIVIRQERFAWHRLHEAIEQLRDVELDILVSDATAAVAAMMRADAAEIQLYAKTGYATLLRASDVEDAHTPEEDESAPGHSMDIPLSTREGQIGELRLLFHQTVKLNETESDCLAAFANALAVALANALKFEAIREEAYRRIRAAYVDPVTGV